jgi:hypothetical protein
VASSTTAGNAAGPRKPCQQSNDILESALSNILQIVEKMADEEEWSPARRQERLLEIRDPVKTLIRAARATQHDTAVATWATQVRALTDEVVEVIDNQSMDYTLDKVNKKLQLMAKHGSGHQEGWDRGDSGSPASCLGQATAQPGDFCKIFSPAHHRVAGQHVLRPGCGQEVKTGLWARQAAGRHFNAVGLDPGPNQPVSSASCGGANPLDRCGDQAPVQ